MVSPWANRFRGSYVSIDNDPRPGRPRTSTVERSVKIVADALEEDRRATCEEFLHPREQDLRRNMHKNRPQLLVAGPLILHDNSLPHIADVVTKKFRDYGWEVLPVPHAPYRPEMSPSDVDYSQS